MKKPLSAPDNGVLIFSNNFKHKDMKQRSGICYTPRIFVISLILII